MEPTPWMTKTGAIVVAISGALGGAAQILPIPDVKPWVDFLALLLGGIGAALMGQGIRRNIPTDRTGA
jgi:hypothetical protein